MTAWNDFIKEHRGKPPYKDIPYRRLLKILSPLYKNTKNPQKNNFQKTKLNYK